MPEPKTQETPTQSKAWVMPKVNVGEIVYWSHVGSDEKLLGLVTSSTNQHANLTLFADGQPGTRQVRGARHVTDPSIPKAVQLPGGVWQHTEIGKKIHELID